MSDNVRLLNLLAIIHCDGGHYTAEHGVEKSTHDAMAVINKLKVQHDRAQNEATRLKEMLNQPHLHDFIKAVKLEALHQRERHGAEHDAGKSDEDWLFLVGFLGGKAVQAGKTATDFKETGAYLEKEWGDGREELQYAKTYIDKRLHHIITMAAVCLNWHAHHTGADTRMRPGIAEEKRA